MLTKKVLHAQIYTATVLIQILTIFNEIFLIFAAVLGPKPRSLALHHHGHPMAQHHHMYAEHTLVDIESILMVR